MNVIGRQTEYAKPTDTEVDECIDKLADLLFDMWNENVKEYENKDT